MKYRKADLVLPSELLAEIQKFIQGECLYIPKSGELKKRWGECSGGRKLLDERNAEIRRRFSETRDIIGLATEFFLSADSIRKIIYGK